MTVHPRKIAGQRPITAKSPPPEVKVRASRNGGSAAHARATAAQTPAEKWRAAVPAVLERFRETMAGLYADEEDQMSGNCAAEFRDAATVHTHNCVDFDDHSAGAHLCGHCGILWGFK